MAADYDLVTRSTHLSQSLNHPRRRKQRSQMRSRRAGEQPRTIIISTYQHIIWTAQLKECLPNSGFGCHNGCTMVSSASCESEKVLVSFRKLVRPQAELLMWRLAEEIEATSCPPPYWQFWFFLVFAWAQIARIFTTFLGCSGQKCNATSSKCKAVGTYHQAVVCS